LVASVGAFIPCAKIGADIKHRCVCADCLLLPLLGSKGLALSAETGQGIVDWLRLGIVEGVEKASLEVDLINGFY